MQLVEARRNAVVRDLNNHLTQVSNQLEGEKRRNEDVKQKRRDNKKPENWWEEPIEGFNLTQLVGFKSGLENLKKAVAVEGSKYVQATVPHRDFCVGSCSNAAFGINTDLDLFNRRGMMSMDTLNYNHNMIVPNNTIPFGNNGNPNNITQGFIPEYNMNYIPEFNQNQCQCFKQEHISEYDHRPDHPPHFGHD